MTISQTIATELPFFDTLEEKEIFLLVVGALSLRLISLRKACELMNIDQKSLLKLLDTMHVNFSFLEDKDIEIENQW